MALLFLSSKLVLDLKTVTLSPFPPRSFFVLFSFSATDLGNLVQFLFIVNPT